MIETQPRIGTTMAVESIGPATASRYLETASTNRRIRKGKIDQYARDMLGGRWHSSVLRFDDLNRLVDGQHRLWAIISSDTTQVFYVERGLPAEALSTIDSGLSRTAGDVLAIRGAPSAITLAGAIRYARWFENFPGRAPSGQSASPFSHDELVDYLDANPEINDSVRMSKNLTKVLPFKSGALAAALHFLGHKRNPELADEFWRQMNQGTDMKAGTGPYLLRRLVIADNIRRPGERMSINTLAALSIKAWNLWEAGKTGRQLRWIKGAQQQEAFPRFGAKPAAEDLED